MGAQAAGPATVRVLGPLQVVGPDGADVPLGGAKQRAVLAVLALHPRRPVSVDRIIDEVWGESPPPTATGALQVYVSALRKALRPVFGREVIVTRRPGYLLDVSADELDADRFAAHLAAGRAAATVGSHEPARRELRAALDLWRGAVLADLTFAGDLGRTAEQLTEGRLDALEAAAAVESVAGTPTRMIAELEAALVDHPLREGLWGQLVLALYRSGRQADALRTFARARTLLADELGIDPGPELRELELRVLRQDPALSARPAARAGRPPRPVTPLVGRRTELARAHARLGDGTRVLTLTGMGGIGKTRLALALAADLAESGRDVVWAGLAACTDAGQALDAVGRALKVARSSGEPLLDVLCAALDGRIVTLMLDNCEQIPDLGPDIAALLAEVPDLTVVVTSRIPLRIRGEQELAVPPLAIPSEPRDGAADHPDGAVELFVQRAAAVRGDRPFDAGDRAHLGPVCALLDGVPLAIELAAARLKSFSLTQLRDRLERPLTVLVAGPRDLPDRQQTLRATLDWSWQLLADDERATLARAAVFAGSFGLPALETVNAAVAAADPSGSRSEIDIPVALAALLDHGFVRPEVGAEDVRFSLLHLVREFAAARLAESGDEPAARRAHAALVLDLAERAAGGITGVYAHEADEALGRWLPDLRLALAWSAEHGDPARVAAGFAAFWRMWPAQGLLAEGRGWAERITAAGGGGPEFAMAAGILDYLADDFATALAGLTGAAADATAAGDESLAVTAQAWTLAVHLAAGDIAAATADSADVLARARTVGSIEARHRALYSAAWLAYLAGDTIAARVHTEEDLALSLDRGDTLAAIEDLNNLAELALDEGRPDDAAESVTLLGDLAERLGTAVALRRADLARGSLALVRGDADKAEVAFAAALDRSRRLGQPTEAAAALRGLAAAAALAGDDDRCVTRLAAAAKTAGRPGVGRTDETPVPESYIEALVAPVRRRLAPSRLTALWQRGQLDG